MENIIREKSGGCQYFSFLHKRLGIEGAPPDASGAFTIPGRPHAQDRPASFPFSSQGEGSVGVSV